MISVIIPAYNEESYIEPTLKSLQNQTFKDFETIVVCNGCTDKTAEIAGKYTDKVYETEKGVIKAKNFGAKKAKNEILVFLDADTSPSPKVLEEISKIKNHFGTCKGDIIENNLKLKLMYMGKGLFCKPFKLFNGILFCRKEHFQKTNGYDTYPLENRALTKKLKKHAGYIIIKEPIKTSMRRYQKYGIITTTIKLAKNRSKKNKTHEEIR